MGSAAVVRDIQVADVFAVKLEESPTDFAVSAIVSSVFVLEHGEALCPEGLLKASESSTALPWTSVEPAWNSRRFSELHWMANRGDNRRIKKGVG